VRAPPPHPKHPTPQPQIPNPQFKYNINKVIVNLKY